MKKRFFLLFILLLNFSFSDNFDQFTSKRVFEKLLNCSLSGNFRKCRNDKELTRAMDYKEFSESIIEIEEMFKTIKLSEDVKYEIINVQEKQNESIITINLKIRQITDTPEKVYDEVDKLIPEGQKDITADDLIIYYPKIKDKLKYKFTESVVTIYMDKQNNQWDIIETGINDNFFESLFGGLQSFLKYFEFEDIE